ncbi:MAG: hypothetical protein GY847_09215 [Proteobacteria bacterium]|nr:hypothetical protein [Pseudomonadota bacterium]
MNKAANPKKITYRLDMWFDYEKDGDNTLDYKFWYDPKQYEVLAVDPEFNAYKFVTKNDFEMYLKGVNLDGEIKGQLCIEFKELDGGTPPLDPPLDPRESIAVNLKEGKWKKIKHKGSKEGKAKDSWSITQNDPPGDDYNNYDIKGTLEFGGKVFSFDPIVRVGPR